MSAIEARVEDFLSSIVTTADHQEEELETVQFALTW
jgi:hypothetical protein